MSLRAIVAAIALTLGAASAQIPTLELAVNGGFETGDFTGWTEFPSAPGSITIGAPGLNSAFAGCIDNMQLASASLIKNANIGIGSVMPGQAITISFDARGATAVGGVVFAEFFSEVAGGGVSAAEILGGAPLALDPNPNTWTGFSFTTTAGPDVAGGVTLQLAAITGGAPGSMSMVCFDNVSVTIPAPVITYPGSGDDLALASAVGIGSALSNADIKTAFAGDVIRVNVKSPMTTYDFMAYSLVGQLVATASGAGSVPGFPEAHLDLLNPVFFMVNGTLASPLGSFNPLLPNVGSMTHYLTPPGLNGSSLIMQAIISDPGANNAFFAATDAHEIQFN